MLIRNLFFFGFVSLCCVFVYFCFLFEFYHKIGHISVFSQVVTLKPIPLLPFGATAIWGQSSKMEQYFLKRGLSFDQNGYLVETNENNKSHKNSTNGDGNSFFNNDEQKLMKNATFCMASVQKIASQSLANSGILLLSNLFYSTKN